ncbi:MAG: MFS family permease, partial [Paracoccaceae bacterium]
MSDQTNTTNGPYYGWVIVALAFMTQAIASGSTNALYGVFAVPFSDAFGASRAQVLMATASVAMIASGLLSPLAGYWLSRYRPKTMILTGGAMLSVGFAVMTQVQALWQVSLVYAICWSAGNCLYGTLAANTSVSNWFAAQRGRALGFAAIGM